MSISFVPSPPIPAAGPYGNRPSTTFLSYASMGPSTCHWYVPKPSLFVVNISDAVHVPALFAILQWREPLASIVTLFGLPWHTPAMPPDVTCHVCPFQLNV